MIVGACLMPHPPMAVAEIGRGSEKSIQKTLDSYHSIAEVIKDLKPDTIVVISPHATLYRDWFNVSGGKSAYGDFARFRAAGVSFDQQYDTEFVRLLEHLCKADGFPAGTQYDRDKFLDHGTMVPLYFVNQHFTDYKLVRIGLSGFSLKMHYELGRYIQKTANALNSRVYIIASGDLSHCQKVNGPYGFQKEGPVYDARIMKTMGNADFAELFQYDEAFLKKAMECGHRSFVMMAGALDRTDVKPHMLSHQDITGVGYGFVYYDVGQHDDSRNFSDQYEAKEMDRILNQNSDAYVKLARASIQAFVEKKERIAVPEMIPEEMKTMRAGTFVSIHEFGELRGCIGTISPVYANVAEEIIHNGISACSKDPRFQPVQKAELPYLDVSVDVLRPSERVSDLSMLDVRKYGVICSLPDGRRGLLLPDLEGVDTVEEQIRIACSKGGIDPDDERLMIERFEVVRHV